jgi:hypothetical protein
MFCVVVMITVMVMCVEGFYSVVRDGSEGSYRVSLGVRLFCQ